MNISARRPGLIALAALLALALSVPVLAQPPGTATAPTGRQAGTGGITPSTQPASPPAAGAQAPGAGQPGAGVREPAAGDLQEKTSVTKHTIRIGGQPIAYTATTGNLVLRDDRGKAIASFFYVYYTRDGVTDLAKRPIFYSFNGGPGTASIWMHVGFTGPRRVTYDEDGFQLRPPYRLHDNEHSILDVADIVYIDPVGVGLQPHGAGRGRAPVPRRGRRHRGDGRLHPHVHLAAEPLEVAEVPHRRELRDDARVGAGRLPAEPAPDVHERRGAGVDDEPRLRARSQT